MSILKLEPQVSNSSANFSFGNVFASNFYYSNGALFSAGTGSVKYTSASVPPVANNSPGDQWFNSATQTLYEYVNNGGNNYWVEILTPSFPSSPVNGQAITIKGVAYTYDSSTGSWTRTNQSAPTVSVIVDTFISDGVTTNFTLSTTPSAKELITVNIDGVLQQKTAYNLSSNVLSLTGTPINGAVIEVKTPSATQSSVLTGLVYDTFTGDGVSTLFTLSSAPVSKNFTIVTINGVVQQKSKYNITGTVLNFVTAPSASALIDVTTFGPAISSTSSIAAGSDSQVQFNSSGMLMGASNLTFTMANSTLTVGNISTTKVNASSINSTGNIIGLTDLYIGNGASTTSFTNPIAIFKDAGLTYVQTAIVNSNGNGSADITTYGNNGDDTQSWTDIGFTGNTFNDPNYSVTSAGDGYLFVQGNTNFGGNLVVATGSNGTTKDIVFATGGFQAGNIKARLYNSNGTFNVSNTLSAGNLYTTGSLTVLGAATFQLASDTMASLTGATGVVTHDALVGAVFYHNSPAANFTANFTNLPTTDGRVLMMTVIVNQGATPYIPSAVQIAGAAQTIKWANNTVPSGNASKIDIFSFSLLRTGGTWVVLGSAATFG